MDYTVHIEGLDELIGRLAASPELINKELKRAMTRAVVGELGRMPAYPPAPPTSSYRRTGLLGRSLTSLIGSASGSASDVTQSGEITTGIVGTNVVYASYVIGKQQARAFAGRWWRLEESVLSHKAQIQAEFDEVPQRIVDEVMAG